jgi:hypothetical protein
MADGQNRALATTSMQPVAANPTSAGIITAQSSYPIERQGQQISLENAGGASLNPVPA